MFEAKYLGMVRLAQTGEDTGGGRYPAVPLPPNAPPDASPEVKQKASECYWYWSRLNKDGRQLPLNLPPGMGPFYSSETLEYVGKYRQCLEEFKAELEFVGPRLPQQEPFKFPEFDSAPFGRVDSRPDVPTKTTPWLRPIYPEPLFSTEPLWKPPPPTPLRPRNIPEGAYSPVPTPAAGAQQSHGGVFQPAPVASTQCPPGQFWDGRQCRGSIGTMPSLPGGGPQGVATGVQMPGGGGGYTSFAGAAFMGAVRLVMPPMGL